MRILSYLFLTLFVFSLTACSSDDDNNPPNNPEPEEVTLLGSWNATEFTIDGSFMQSGTNADFSMLADDLTGNTLVFNADNTVTGDNAPFEMDMTITTNGMPPFTSTQTMSEVMAHSGEWNRNGSTLTLTEDGSTEPQIFTIEILNATTLKISGNQDSLGNTSTPTPAGAEFTATVTYSR